MSRNLSPINYESELYIYTTTEDGSTADFTTPSIISFYMYRIPFLKVGSFGLITVSLPFYVIMNIQRHIASGQGLPGAYLSFYIANTKQHDNSKYRTYQIDENSKLKLFLKIMHVQYRGSPPSIFAQIVPVTLYVVPQQLHDLTIGNSFLRLVNDDTAPSVFNQYKEYLKETYSSSDPTFEFKDYDSNLNNHVYDNIFTKCASDLEIPNLLLKHYKMSNGVTYFFFDSMTFKAQNYGLLINLLEYDSFEVWDAFDDDKYDVSNSLRLIKKIPLSNSLNTLRSPFNSAAWHIRDANNSITHDKTDGERFITKFNKIIQEEPNINILERNSVYIDMDEPVNYGINSGQSAALYAPDSVESAKIRYNNLSNFLASTDGVSHGFYRYEIVEVHFDAIQFDRQYILDEEDINARFVPISIVNIFSKFDPIKTTLRHTAQFNSIKYN